MRVDVREHITQDSAWLRRLPELVPDAVNGLDHVWIGGIAFQLGAQPADMYVHGSGAAHEVVAPHAVKQHLAREYLQGVGGQEDQQVELLWFQLYSFAIARNLTARHVNHYVAAGHRNRARLIAG